jgi:hypothetical protein
MYPFAVGTTENVGVTPANAFVLVNCGIAVPSPADLFPTEEILIT